MSDTLAAEADLNPDVGETWRRSNLDRCRQAFSEACSSADRLALLRSWVRLEHGWLNLTASDVTLTDSEHAMLGRFGLALSADSGALRLDEHADDSLNGELEVAMRLETARRSLSSPASPDAALRRHLTHSAYRTPTQKSAVRALLTAPSGSGLLVSMPTGSGKSLLFQLAPLFWRDKEPGACCVVITPTVSLALDHARTLSQLPGLEGSQALTGEIQGEARDSLLSAFRRGEVPVLFMSPELAMSPAREALLDAARPPAAKASHLKARLRGFFIDEAHIVESWGRGFRPDFQRLPALLRDLRQAAPDLTAILLSATLTPGARSELRRAYSPAGPWLEIDAHTPRYELDIVIRSFADAVRREDALLRAIDLTPRPAIVYTTQVDDAAKLHRTLKARGYERLEMFTGEVSDTAVRRRIVADWANNKLDLVVATSAFGLGIDKADVRSVIHTCLPEGPARWYQEIGRASRDGHQGLAVCLFTDTTCAGRNDVAEALRQATGAWLSRDLAEKRWRALMESAVGSRFEGSERRLTLDLDAVREGLSVLHDSDYNRGWNMSLLNLMQRAGAIEVLSVAVTPDGVADFVWEVAVRDPRVLASVNTTVWDEIYRVRDAELAQATRELDRFVRLMTSPSHRCLTAAVYELIEGLGEVAPPACGRCPACRSAGERPPRRSPALGLERTWNGTPPNTRDCSLPGGIVIVEPADPEFGRGLGTLIQKLGAVGIEQLLVPDALSASCCDHFAQSSAVWGLVLNYSEWLGPAEGSLAPLPAALLLPPSELLAERLLARLRACAEAHPSLPLLIIGRRDQSINKRRIDQAYSRHSPYTEEMLEALLTHRSPE